MLQPDKTLKIAPLMSAPQCFGEAALLRRGPRIMTTVKATSTCKVFSFLLLCRRVWVVEGRIQEADVCCCFSRLSASPHRAVLRLLQGIEGRPFPHEPSCYGCANGKFLLQSHLQWYAVARPLCGENAAPSSPLLLALALVDLHVTCSSALQRIRQGAQAHILRFLRLHFASSKAHQSAAAAVLCGKSR